MYLVRHCVILLRGTLMAKESLIPRIIYVILFEIYFWPKQEHVRGPE